MIVLVPTERILRNLNKEVRSEDTPHLTRLRSEPEKISEDRSTFLNSLMIWTLSLDSVTSPGVGNDVPSQALLSRGTKTYHFQEDP